MSVIERVSLNLSNKLGEKLDKTEEEISVLNYGLFIILHTLMSVVVTLFIGLLAGIFSQIVIISLCAAMMKRYSGGVHASSPGRCTLIGVLLTTILAFLCKLFVRKLGTVMFIGIIILGMGICYHQLYRKCPVPSKNKPMKKESTRLMLRKKAFKLMNVYILLIIVFSTLYIFGQDDLNKTISMSILLGVGMQVFVLSDIGEKLILNLDRLMSRIGF